MFNVIPLSALILLSLQFLRIDGATQKVDCVDTLDDMRFFTDWTVRGNMSFANSSSELPLLFQDNIGRDADGIFFFQGASDWLLQGFTRYDGYGDEKYLYLRYYVHYISGNSTSGPAFVYPDPCCPSAYKVLDNTRDFRWKEIFIDLAYLRTVAINFGLNGVSEEDYFFVDKIYYAYNKQVSSSEDLQQICADIPIPQPSAPSADIPPYNRELLGTSWL